MGAPKQLAVLKSQFESPAYEGVSRAETGNARLLHVNLVRSWIRDIADSDSYADNAAAKAAGLKKGDLYHTAGILKIVID
tara:strand:- start:997 stop:1236 length:240 start_codon:yes stop_codon:yes gene_type:complete